MEIVRMLGCTLTNCIYTITALYMHQTCESSYPWRGWCSSVQFGAFFLSEKSRAAAPTERGPAIIWSHGDRCERSPWRRSADQGAVVAATLIFRRREPRAFPACDGKGSPLRGGTKGGGRVDFWGDLMQHVGRLGSFSIRDTLQLLLPPKRGLTWMSG